MMSGRQPHIIKALHDRYGPIVRVGVNTVSFSTARAWKDIYGHIPSRPQFLKSPVYANEGTNKKVLSIVSELDPHKHGKIRRLQSHAFSAKALNEQEGVVQSYVDKLIRQIGVHATGENGEEMVKWFNFATFDIIGDLAFGEPFGSLDDGKPHFWVSMILDAMTAAAWKMVIFRYIGSSRITKYIMPKSMQEKREKHFKYSRDKIERYLVTDSMKLAETSANVLQTYEAR